MVGHPRVGILDSSLNPISSVNPLVVSPSPVISSDYVLNDLDEASSTVTYLGKAKSDGTWLLVKLDSSSGLSMRYANNSNNSSVSSYSSAWSSRATLTYDEVQDLTGL